TGARQRASQTTGTRTGASSLLGHQRQHLHTITADTHDLDRHVGGRVASPRGGRPVLPASWVCARRVRGLDSAEAGSTSCVRCSVLTEQRTPPPHAPGEVPRSCQKSGTGCDHLPRANADVGGAVEPGGAIEGGSRPNSNVRG